MFDILIFIVVISNLVAYALGIKMAKEMDLKHIQAYEKYGSPKFYIFGPNEYKFLFFVLFGEYKRIDLDEEGVKAVNLYRYFFIFNILLLILFLVVMVRVNR